MDIKNIQVIRKKEPKMTDPIRYPKVTGVYEDNFKKDYTKVLHDMVYMIAAKMGEYV